MMHEREPLETGAKLGRQPEPVGTNSTRAYTRPRLFVVGTAAELIRGHCCYGCYDYGGYRYRRHC